MTHKPLNHKEYENTIYHDAARYDDEHWWKKDDLDFWRDQLDKSAGKTVLELACGTGRIAGPLLEKGADFTGIEISPEFCDRARTKLIDYGERVSIHQGDIRNFTLNRKFDLIIIGFNSFLHLLTDDDALACLACVRNHMHKNSRFVIDIFLPNPLFLYRPEGMRYPVMEYRESQTDQLIQVEETNWYDPETGINKIRWYYNSDDVDDQILEFSMRMFWPDTMNCLLIDSGLKINHVWGDYSGTDFSESSNLHIYDCSLD